MVSWPVNRRGISGKQIETLGIRICCPGSGPSSKPAGNVTAQSGSIKRIHQDPVADGETVSERRVARIMKENTVSPRPNKRRKPVTTDSNHNMSPSANLLEQDFHCLTPNAVWLVDITCIDTDEGWQCDPPNRTVLIRPPLPPEAAAAKRRDRLAKGRLAATGCRSRCTEITGPSRRGRMWV